MKINWFSPLSPAATDIAHYTARVVPALSAVAEITLWTTKRQWARSLEDFAEVRRYGLNRLPWTDLNRADMTFYHIGNNPRFHRAIWHVSGVHPGVVVLHDFRLHHFFDGIYRLQYQSLDMYLEVMEKFYGQSALSDARECFTTNASNIDYMAQHYPLTELALRNPLGVVVHSKEAFDALQSKFEWPLIYAPLPYPSAVRPIREPPSPPYRLIICGYLGKNRRLDSVFRALAGMPERDQFRLDVYGTILDDEESVEAQLRTLKLTGLVKLHGFASEEKLEAALASSHLALNLRFPTVGEASGSQLRIWSHALPSLVSKVGWYASLPPEAVCFVRHDEHEVGDIQKHLRAFLNEPEGFAKMGRRGLEELRKRHSPEAYARTLIEIAERAQGFRPHAAAAALARRAALLTEWLGPGGNFDDQTQHVVSEALSLVRD
jgi:glycosyltransferase involved in cell wall biosynthesis